MVKHRLDVINKQISDIKAKIREFQEQNRTIPPITSKQRAPMSPSRPTRVPDSLTTKSKAELEPYGSLHHPKLDLIIGECLFSPLNYSPSSKYPKYSEEILQKIKVLKHNPSHKHADLPYDIDKSRNDFLVDVLQRRRRNVVPRNSSSSGSMLMEESKQSNVSSTDPSVTHIHTLRAKLPGIQTVEKLPGMQIPDDVSKRKSLTAPKREQRVSSKVAANGVYVTSAVAKQLTDTVHSSRPVARIRGFTRPSKQESSNAKVAVSKAVVGRRSDYPHIDAPPCKELAMDSVDADYDFLFDGDAKSLGQIGRPTVPGRQVGKVENVLGTHVESNESSKHVGTVAARCSVDTSVIVDVAMQSDPISDITPISSSVVDEVTSLHFTSLECSDAYAEEEFDDQDSVEAASVVKEGAMGAKNDRVLSERPLMESDQKTSVVGRRGSAEVGERAVDEGGTSAAAAVGTDSGVEGEYAEDFNDALEEGGVLQESNALEERYMAEREDREEGYAEECSERDDVVEPLPVRRPSRLPSFSKGLKTPSSEQLAANGVTGMGLDLGEYIHDDTEYDESAVSPTPDDASKRFSSEKFTRSLDAFIETQKSGILEKKLSILERRNSSPSQSTSIDVGENKGRASSDKGSYDNLS